MPLRLALPAILALLILAAFTLILTEGSWLGVLLAAALIILIHAALIYALRDSDSEWRHVHDHQSLLCPACRYDLRNSADRGPCPECGSAYDKSDLPRIWNEILHGERPAPDRAEP